VIAQARFLEFIMAKVKQYPNFELIMGAQVSELIEEEGKVKGVRYRGRDGWYELKAVLTVAADGRSSRLRKLAGQEPIKDSPPMDVLWFRLSRKVGDPEIGIGGRFGKGVMIALIDRFDYWQVGYIIAKGEYQHQKAQGLEHIKKVFAEAVPEMADRIAEIQDWRQISVLSVEASHIKRWHRPGLLLIGDAAHAMSPVGGVGINYAIQDAIAASNVLGERLQFGIVRERDLEKIQRQREFPTRVMQMVQTVIQKIVVNKSFEDGYSRRDAVSSTACRTFPTSGSSARENAWFWTLASKNKRVKERKAKKRVVCKCTTRFFR
jgi:2-polyprenyl-6-methoxyphenol hydroxylase-like FAD-dependent oxidoreductase